MSLEIQADLSKVEEVLEVLEVLVERVCEDLGVKKEVMVEARLEEEESVVVALRLAELDMMLELN